MRRSDLGEFEEMVMLAVAVLSPLAYSVMIAQELEVRSKYPVSIGAVHAALQRLEKKGYLSSSLGDPTAERGGRRKRLFALTVYGGKILRDVHAVRSSFWERISAEILSQLGLNLNN